MLNTKFAQPLMQLQSFCTCICPSVLVQDWFRATPIVASLENKFIEHGNTWPTFEDKDPCAGFGNGRKKEAQEKPRQSNHVPGG